MLGGFVITYLIISICIGLWAARRVHNAEDFMLAGRSLPLSLATFTVFATWFGSETLLGASATFAEEGLLGVIEDPFGASLCLILVGLFFAKYFYRLNLLTLSDFFRDSFGTRAELVSAICMALSFFAWVAGQLTALGVVIYAIFGMPILQGIVIIGITFVAIFVTPTDMHWEDIQWPEHFFSFTPHNASIIDILDYICAWITLGLGSIPSQDIFQRVMSSKDENVAARSALLAGGMYLIVGMIPLYLAFMAKYVWHIQVEDNQSLLTAMVVLHTPLAIQNLFFGALISAVLSTASGAILAPASVISENIVKPIFKIGDSKKLLLMERLAVIFVALIAMLLALGNSNIYEMVGEASALGLVSLFIPMMMAMHNKHKNEAAAILSMVCGMCAYLLSAYVVPVAFPPLLLGLLVSILGYIIPAYILSRK